ncbi:MAG: STAS domain-containing protein [Streptosporangiaceae bacterium]
MAMLTLSERQDDTAVTVVVTGDLDFASRALVMACAWQALRNHPGRLVIDASGLTFMDAAGLGALVAVRVRAARQRTALEVAGAPPHVLRVMDVTGTRCHFQIT